MDKKEDDRPPIFGTWRKFYFVLLGYLVALILIFYALTRWLS